MEPTASSRTSDLKARWDAYRQEHPNVRTRNTAAALGVSEAELVATADGATRLDGPWTALLSKLEGLGEVMALTRNEACVHEKTGHYRNVEFHKQHGMGLVLDKQIDLRLFMDHWHFGLAVREPWDGARDGIRRSLQFFDRHGTAVHKVYLRRSSDTSAYDALVETHRNLNQEAAPEIVPRPAPTPDRPDEEINAAAFLKGWRTLKDTHDFFSLLKKHGVSRTQAVRLAEGEFTERAHPAGVRQLLQQAAAHETPIMVFVGNHGCIQIHTGPVHTLKEHGPWYNVLDPGFNLHLNEDLVDQAWIVRKPTTDGTVTALELFDAEDEVIAMFFGERKPGKAELESWRSIVADLPRL